MKKNKKCIFSIVVRIAVVAGTVFTVGILLFIVGYILIKGVPHLKLSLFEFEYNSTNTSMMPAIINTILMIVLTLVIAIPIGVITTIYLTEYSKRNNLLIRIIRITTETLSGIPSIIYGLFGYIFFVIFMKFDYSLLSGALTLPIMILPIIIRTTEEALLAVPNSYREGSYGLGAGKIRTIFKIVLPAAFQGIFAGIILSIGRIVGESAALIYTAGTVPKIASSLLSSTRTLSVHMYSLWSEGLYTNEAYATAVVLLIIVIGINALANRVSKKIIKR